MIHRFHTGKELAEKLSAEFLSTLQKVPEKKELFLAFSGGNTPRVFFEILAGKQDVQFPPIPWQSVHFFWADERCVPVNHEESNYGTAYRILLKHLPLEDRQVHRIAGENNPAEEAQRYAREIQETLQRQNSIPVFDWIFLGVGEDGHTASIFPDRPDLLDSPLLCAAVRNPYTGQERITLTGSLIKQAKRVSFLVTGASKSEVVRMILGQHPGMATLPAAWVYRNCPHVEWYLDGDAAKAI